MHQHQVSLLALELMEQHGLIAQGWSFGFNRAKTGLGLCRHHLKKIELSVHHLGNEAVVRDTMLHEIAHALVGPGHGHDYVWRRKCIAIGGNGERCGDSGNRVEHAWKAVCPTCGNSSGQHRAPLRVSACSKCCKGRYNKQHALVWHKQGRRVPVSQMPPRFQQEAMRLGIA